MVFNIKGQTAKVKQKLTPQIPTFEKVEVKSELGKFGSSAADQVTGKGLFAKKPSQPEQPSPIVEAMLQTTKGADELTYEMTKANREREERERQWSQSQDQAMSQPQGEKKRFVGLPSSASKQPGMPKPGSTPKNHEMMKKKG